MDKLLVEFEQSTLEVIAQRWSNFEQDLKTALSDRRKDFLQSHQDGSTVEQVGCSEFHSKAHRTRNQNQDSTLKHENTEENLLLSSSVQQTDQSKLAGSNFPTASTDTVLATNNRTVSYEEYARLSKAHDNMRRQAGHYQKAYQQLVSRYRQKSDALKKAQAYVIKCRARQSLEARQSIGPIPSLGPSFSSSGQDLDVLPPERNLNLAPTVDTFNQPSNQFECMNIQNEEIRQQSEDEAGHAADFASELSSRVVRPEHSSNLDQTTDARNRSKRISTADLIPSSQSTDIESEAASAPAERLVPPKSGSSPIVVGTRSLKRKRIDTAGRYTKKFSTLQDVELGGDAQEPISVKDEDYSSPIGLAAIHSTSNFHDLDLDEIPGDIETPRKHKRIQMLLRTMSSLDPQGGDEVSSRHPGMDSEEYSFGDITKERADEEHRPEPIAKVKPADIANQTQKRAIQEQQPGLQSLIVTSSNERNNDTKRQILKPLSLNKPVSSYGGDKRAWLRRHKNGDNLAAVETLSEDGEKYAFEPFSKSHNNNETPTRKFLQENQNQVLGDAGTPKLVSTRVSNLLETRSPEKAVLSVEHPMFLSERPPSPDRPFNDSYELAEPPKNIKDNRKPRNNPLKHIKTPHNKVHKHHSRSASPAKDKEVFYKPASPIKARPHESKNPNHRQDQLQHNAPSITTSNQTHRPTFPPASSSSSVSTSKPSRKTLRTRALENLTLDDFKINPTANQGLSYAYADPVRTAAAKRCLPNCTDSCCAGSFRTLVEFGGLAPKPRQSLLDAIQLKQHGRNKPKPSPAIDKTKTSENSDDDKNSNRNKAATDDDDNDNDNDNDTRLLTDYLGPSSEFRLSKISKEDRKELILQAKAQELSRRHGRHRKAWARRTTPPGFWRTDMPTTQETEEDRARARQVERTKIEERWREAMKEGGRWMFRDE